MPNENEPQNTSEPNAEAESLRVQLEAAKQQTKSVVDSLLATVPERLKGLIPDGEPAAQLAWFAKAKQTGVFDAPNVAKTDEGKPTVTPKAVDFSTLPPEARMSAGYKR